MNRQPLMSFVLGMMVLWAALDAGHSPPPPPVPPKDHMRGAKKMDINSGQQAEGIFGPKEMYPVLDGMQLMPLERLHDLSKLKYEDASATWSWEWEELKEGSFLLPAEAMIKSTEVIKLSQEVFKKFRDSDIEELAKSGPPILPLLLAELGVPEYPIGWGALDAQGRKSVEAETTTRKKVRGQAFDLLMGIPGSIGDPYRYLGLVDLDAGIRSKAVLGFSAAGREPSLGALLLLWTHDRSAELDGLLKPLMEKEVPGSYVKAEALRKATGKELLKLLKDAQLPPRCLVVGLERLDIPSFTGDDNKAERKKAEVELKLIEEALAPHFAKWVGKGTYEAPEGKVREAGEHEILLWHMGLKLGKGEVYARLEEVHRDSRWWVRLLVARALSDAWEQRKDATPKLLERQRDWFYAVRREANRSLQALHRLNVSLEVLPALPADSFVIDQWEKWWLGRQGIKGLDDSNGWTSIQLKAEEGNVYSPMGPVRHKFVTGKMGSLQLSLIDHNGNDRYDDFGIDNFSVGALDKPGTFLSHLARMNGKYHFLKFDPKTFMLMVKPYDGPLGRVKVKESYAKEMALEFLVIGKSADVTIQVERDAKTRQIELEVPAGHYNIYAGNVQRGGKKGNDVYIAHIGTGGNRFFDVPGKGEVEIAMGEPLHFDADIDFITGKGDKPMVRITNPKVIGSFDELYFNIIPDFSALEVRFLEPSGKLIKEFDWRLKADVSKTSENITAEQEAEAKIRNELATIQTTIETLERDIKAMDEMAKSAGVDPRTVDGTKPEYMAFLRYNESIQRLAEWKKHQAATLADSGVFMGDVAFGFRPITLPLEKLPPEYDVEIRGKVFFGQVEPLKIRIKGEKREGAKDPVQVTGDATRN